MIHSWFKGIKRKLLCLFQDMKIPTSRSVVKYGIGIYKISREVWNSSLFLHCYCFGWSIQQLQEVREVGFRSPWSSSAYPQWYIHNHKHGKRISQFGLDIIPLGWGQLKIWSNKRLIIMGHYNGSKSLHYLRGLGDLWKLSYSLIRTCLLVRKSHAGASRVTRV